MLEALEIFFSYVCHPFVEAVRGWKQSPDWIDLRTEEERKAVDDKRFQAKLRGEKIAP